MNRVLRLSKSAALGWVEDGASSMGASIAYYTVFSIAPLLVIVIAVAGMVWGDDAVRGAVHLQLAGILGSDAAMGIEKMLQGAQSTTSGAISGLIGVVVLIVGATTVFGELQTSLDKIWHAPESAKPSGIWALLRTRLLSFGLILALGFLLLVSLLMSAVVGAFAGWLSSWLPAADLLLQGVNTVVSISIEAVLFAMIFKFMPSVPIAWRDVWMGAFVTAVLLEIGKVGIGLYLGKSSTVDSYTAAGSVVVLLLWVYYAAQIFLFGAEFTRVFAQEHGSHQEAQGTSAKRATSPVPALSPMGAFSTVGAASTTGAASAMGAASTTKAAFKTGASKTVTGAPASGVVTTLEVPTLAAAPSIPVRPLSAVVVVPVAQPAATPSLRASSSSDSSRGRFAPSDRETKDAAAANISRFLLGFGRRSSSPLLRWAVVVTGGALLYQRMNDVARRRDS